ncbi:hypothetical protein Tco_1328287 [Tanacetum coccineum]
MTLQQIRALETTNDEEVARKIQAEWDAEEERKRFEELKKIKPKTTLRKPTSLAQERNHIRVFPKRERKGMVKERVTKTHKKMKATITEGTQPSKKPKLRSETIDELRNYLRVVDFEKNAQDKESLEGISMITALQVIDSPDGYNSSFTEQIITSGLLILYGRYCMSANTRDRNGTMIHMLWLREISSTRELDDKMLDHGMEVEE